MSDRTVMKRTMNKGEMKLLINFLTFSRKSLVDAGVQNNRDYDKVFGYPKFPLEAHQYQELYNQEAIAKRIVEVFPDECWSSYPELTENMKPAFTPFETKWNKIVRRLSPWQMLHRADVQSGIGQFGVVLLGWNDGERDLSKPVRGIVYDPIKDEYRNESGRSYDCRFMRVFPQSCVRVTKKEVDSNSDRFGDPLEYDIELDSFEEGSFVDETNASANIQFGTPQGTKSSRTVVQQRVHWHRIIHLADNRGSSEIFGVPRMEQVGRRIYDIRKILGGSAEMFWRGAFPGYAFESHPDNDDAEIDEASIMQQMQEYEDGLKRYLAVLGMTVKPLTPQVADPTNHMTQQLQMICIALGIPMRIFCGSEAGHLASAQDAITWNRRLTGRQNNYLTNFVIRPLIDRFILFGALPKVEAYQVRWNDLNNSSDTDKADVGLKIAQAILQYVTSGAEEVIPVKIFITRVLGWSDEEADAIMSEVKKGGPKLTTKVWKEPIVPTGTKDPAKKTGKGGNQNGLGGKK